MIVHEYPKNFKENFGKRSKGIRLTIDADSK